MKINSSDNWTMIILYAVYVFVCIVQTHWEIFEIKNMDMKIEYNTDIFCKALRSRRIARWQQYIVEQIISDWLIDSQITWSSTNIEENEPCESCVHIFTTVHSLHLHLDGVH